MKVELSARADARLDAIEAYLERRNPYAAKQTGDRILQAIEMLEDFPLMGPTWRGRTRALMVTGLPYRVHYRVDEGEGLITVITIAHVRQRPPV